MRKLISVLIVAALILSLLAACTTTPQSVTPTPSTDVGDSQTSTPAEQGKDNVIIVKENTQPNAGNVEYINGYERSKVVDDRVIIILTVEATRQFLTYTPESFSEINAIAVYEHSSQEELNYVQETLNGNIQSNEYNIDIDTFRRAFTIQLSSHDVENVFSAIEILSRRPDIEEAKPSLIEYDAAIVSDGLYSLQDGLSHINIETAWNDNIFGSNEVLVGVIDSGINSSHLDLCNQLYSGSICSHRDYITNPDGVNESAPADNDSHGTAVAGIIAAEANNVSLTFNGGIVGVAPNIKLVSLKANTNIGVKNAINYAQQKGIPILNISMGIQGYDEGIDQAIANYQGLIICSAGNAGVNLDLSANFRTPACLNHENIIVVGAVNDDNEEWYDSISGEASNYGANTVDLFAPGDEIYSTHSSSNIAYCQCFGTSFAAPFVTGVAALILSNNPNIQPIQIKHHILNNVDVDGVIGRCHSNGVLDVTNVFTINLSGYVDIGDDTYHYAKCTVCNGAHELNNRQQHGYSGNYSFYNNKKHSQNCLDCTHKVLSSHISGGGYTNQGTNVGHKTNCSVCGFDYIEAHSWLYNNAFGCYICRKCPARSYNGQSPYGYHDKEMQ